MTSKRETCPTASQPERQTSNGNGVALGHVDLVQKPGPTAAEDATRYSAGRGSDRFGPCCTPLHQIQRRVGRGDGFSANADVAQLVEHFTRNEGVRGSNPRVGSEKPSKTATLSFRVRSEIKKGPKKVPSKRKICA